jgi:ferredoxin-type protein NapF
MDLQRRLFLRGRPTVRQATPAPRPPWAVAETAFVEACTRCNACIAACPEGILVRGDGDYPEVRFSTTGCTACGRCADACEPRVLLRQPGQAPWSWRVSISSACLAQHQVECRVCGEMCDAGAIRFKPTLGGVTSPALDLSLCTGCGACVAPCPTQAIAMKTPTGSAE